MVPIVSWPPSLTWQVAKLSSSSKAASLNSGGASLSVSSDVVTTRSHPASASKQVSRVLRPAAPVTMLLAMTLLTPPLPPPLLLVVVLLLDVIPLAGLLPVSPGMLLV